MKRASEISTPKTNSFQKNAFHKILYMLKKYYSRNHVTIVSKYILYILKIVSKIVLKILFYFRKRVLTIFHEFKKVF